MIKPLLRSVCLIALGLSLITPVIAANQKDPSEANALERGALRMRAFTPEEKNTYAQVVPKTVSQAVAINGKTYRTDLQNAIVFHNLMNSVQQQINQLESHRLIVLDKEISTARVKDFDECNERWFSDYFKNPKVVWNNLKAKTDKLIDDYNQNMAYDTEEKASSDVADLLSGLEEAGVDVTEKGVARQREQIKSTISAYDRKDVQSDVKEVSDVDEAMEDAPEIDISFAVLNSFYPDQDNKDKWGAVRKSAQTHSLPLWEDQKYLYNEKIWKPKYRAIVDTCEKQKAVTGGMIVLPTKEPTIEDEVKYDYYFYDQVQAAHNAFIKMVQAQGCVLPPELVKAPESAPRPLPPAEEEIIIISDSDMVELGTQLYPQHNYFFLHLMDVYAERKQYDDGIALCDSMISQVGDSAIYWYGKSRMYIAKQEYDSCIVSSEKAIELEPMMDGAYYDKGMSYLNKALIFSETVCNDIRNPKCKADRAKLMELYRCAQKPMEKVRELCPDDSERWASPLYRIYLNLNMGKEFAEMEKILNSQ